MGARESSSLTACWMCICYLY